MTEILLHKSGPSVYHVALNDSFYVFGLLSDFIIGNFGKQKKLGNFLTSSEELVNSCPASSEELANSCPAACSL